MDEELNSLIKKLRDEASFVHTEKKYLIELYRQLVKKSEQLFNKQWQIGKQHVLLDDLILGRNKVNLTTNQYCTRFSWLESKSQFVESYKLLGHNDYYVAEFLRTLREKPKYVASLMVRAEASAASLPAFSSAPAIIAILFQSLYGNCVLVQDEFYCLQLLNHFVELQFSWNSVDNGDDAKTTTNSATTAASLNQSCLDLRRLIRKQSCSFNVLFKLYTSFSHSTQLFLTAALYEPITQILTDEWFLDIDPDKALARFSTEEIVNKFGHPSSREYKLKTQKYREKIVNSLYTITMSFIDSINSNLFCFPSSLVWLVNQLYQIVSRNTSGAFSTSNKAVNQQDTARKLCCDVIMALYICPAICDPEPYGVITDVQISTVARHNLMQIANILQVLAMSEDDKDTKAQDLYSKFRNNCVSDILNNIISKPMSSSSKMMYESVDQNTTGNSTTNTNATTTGGDVCSTSSSSIVTNSSNFILTRSSIMISTHDLNRLIVYMRELARDAVVGSQQQQQQQLVAINSTTSAQLDELDEAVKWLRSIIPYDYLKIMLENVASQMNAINRQHHQQASLTAFANNSNTRASFGGAASTALNTPNLLTPDSPEVLSSIFKDPPGHLHPDETSVQQILVVNINDKGIECPGMLSEEKVINECESTGSAASTAASIYMKTTRNRGAKHLLQQQLSVASAASGTGNGGRNSNVSSNNGAANSGPGGAQLSGGQNRLGSAKKHHQFKSSSATNSSNPAAANNTTSSGGGHKRSKYSTAGAKLLSDGVSKSGKSNSVTDDQDDFLDSSFEPSSAAVNSNGATNMSTGAVAGSTASSVARLIKVPSESGMMDDVRSRHDGSVEGISEVNECASISSNDDVDEDVDVDDVDEDDVEDEANQLVEDGLSDFDNFSGRDTPIISGRDTPSSHSHEELQNTSGRAAAGGGGSGARGDTGAATAAGNSGSLAGPTTGLNLMNGVGSIAATTATLTAANSVNAGGVTTGGVGGVGSSNVGGGVLIPRGPQLPVTVQKANREDINDKFCKFEINKINPVKEEQLSETGWSLDADPPESVNNDTINDRLGITDENSLISVSSSSANTVSTYSTNSRYTNPKPNPLLAGLGSTPSTTANITATVAANATTTLSNNNNVTNTPNSALSNFTDQDFLTPNHPISPTDLLTSAASVDLMQTDNTTSAATTMTTTTTNNANTTAANLDELDSDLESSSLNNDASSPSKYTPYSTYSSTYSGPSINQSLLNDLLLNSNNTAQQSSTFHSSVSLPNNNNTSNNTPNNSNSSNMILTHASNSAGNFNVVSNSNSNNSVSAASVTATAGANSSNFATNDFNKSMTSPEPPNSSGSQGRNKLSSIFTSNSNSVKFSLTSTFNNLSNSNQKKSGLQRIFPFNKSSSSSSNAKQQSSQQNDPFASLNPFATSSISSPPTASSSISEPTPPTTSVDSGIDSILKKYANKSATQTPPPTSTSTANTQSSDAQLIDISIPVIEQQQQNQQQQTNNSNQTQPLPKNMSSNSLAASESAAALLQTQISYDPNNLEQSKAFLDAKKKLRIVLSWSDNCTYNFMPIMQFKSSKDNFLTMYLKTQLYDAISLQDKEKEAQLYETMRCVSIFSEAECYKLVRSLKRDYARRLFYMTYLTKSKQSVIYSSQLVDKLSRRADWQQRLCMHRLCSQVTRLFLETKENEQLMMRFVAECRSLVAVDEKFDLFKKYIGKLKREYEAVWTGCGSGSGASDTDARCCGDEMVKLGNLCLERFVLAKVYSCVMFPNGDIDHYRDSKVFECFAELSNVITPSHPLIGIPPIYQNECPWISAQMELRKINLYKTPQDKLACIRKCLLTIQNLLAIAKSPVCADDLHPVLIYVIIKANPPTFLSNVQYIEGFYGSQLESEDYYWAQFIFAFSYIKANMLGNKVAAS